ncbi:AraC family transcriptional regulator [Pedobacter sp. MC2016-05]|uniref:helix-turn-helix domain-containing protein n=1 Tax=Pedobacter sp. MC2016-05 TaxID=2994474 RepID=UPI0022450E28|nr:AraC family transcriptional regulator [Pedobacter sp. MC2016-05]MCX2475564.1 AraC family transcriptional regulator [Pedobacter sp. MC2016-05]
MNDNPSYEYIKPECSIADFVDRFSSLENLSDANNGIIIPNGRIDLLFSKTVDNHFQITLMGLETKPKLIPKLNVSSFFSISFTPLAIEYILHQPIADILNSGKILESNFWDFGLDDLNNFGKFCEKASRKIKSLISKEVDERKRKLFHLIFANNGEMSIKELSEKVAWSERQINRYFNQQLGISLKAYCNILRFQASLPHIKDGQLSPQLNFTDQSHFIKEIKKLSGVSPKELFKNENDRFLQFLVYDKK